MNELVLLLKDEDTSSNTEESSTSSISYQMTAMASFERTYSIVEWSSKDSISNRGTSYLGGYGEVSSKGILKEEDKTNPLQIKKNQPRWEL